MALNLKGPFGITFLLSFLQYFSQWKSHALLVLVSGNTPFISHVTIIFHVNANYLFALRTFALLKVFVWVLYSRMAREAIKYSTMFGPIAFILSWHCLVTAYDVTRTSITQFSLEREIRWRCATSEIYVNSMLISKTLSSC